MTIGKINLTVYIGGNQVNRRRGLSAKVPEDKTVRDALDVVYVAFRDADTAALRRRAVTLDAQIQDPGLVVYPIQRTGTRYLTGQPVPLTTQLFRLGTAEILLVRPRRGGYGR